MRDLPAEVRVGEIFAGRYHILEVVGGGAMGTVVAAHHRLLDRKVAIKFLAPEAIGHTDAVARFVREARATALLESEHVVRVLDVALLESGEPYIVMEYLEGCDLAAWLERHRVLPVEQAVDFILQACDGIAEAHSRQIIHRDIKPANLFAVQRAGVVQSIKVLDFGVSKAEGLVARTLSPSENVAGMVTTQERTMIGTPHYMSPEQMESARDVDARTDIWALGVTLCELVTGRLPYEGKSVLHVYSRIAASPPLRLRDSDPTLPLGLEAIVRRCLERDRERRYGSVVELAAALAALGSTRASSYAERIARRSREMASGPAEGETALSPSPRTLASHVAEKTLPSTPEGVARSGRRSGIVVSLGRQTFGAVVVLGAAALGAGVLMSRAGTQGSAGKEASAPAAVPTATMAPAAAGRELVGEGAPGSTGVATSPPLTDAGARAATVAPRPSPGMGVPSVRNGPAPPPVVVGPGVAGEAGAHPVAASSAPATLPLPEAPNPTTTGANVEEILRSRK